MRNIIITILAILVILPPNIPGGSIFAQNIAEGDSLTWADFIDNYLNGDGEEVEEVARIEMPARHKHQFTQRAQSAFPFAVGEERVGLWFGHKREL